MGGKRKEPVIESVCSVSYTHLAKLPGAAHEWLGIALFALFLFHTALNIRWYRALFRGRYPAKRVVQTVVNLALLIAMLGCVVSAVLISGTVFAAQMCIRDSCSDCPSESPSGL